MNRLFILLICAVVLGGCAAAKKLQTDDLAEFVTWLEGSYSSGPQAEADSDFRDIRLEMKRIWKDKPGYWLYVEQAVAGYLDTPYRQRVYHVTLDEGNIRSEIYTIPGPKRFVLAWKDPQRFDKLTPDSLKVREGCAVILTKAEGFYSGSTVGKGCVSKLADASYATSIADVYPERLVSWDRGY
ncbi:MAG: chromophore lyase CpcT/CpeT, partial [Calditrichota bacterium]